VEQEGKPKTLHYLQKALVPAVESAERKQFRNRKCDLEGNERDGQEDFVFC